MFFNESTENDSILFCFSYFYTTHSTRFLRILATDLRQSLSKLNLNHAVSVTIKKMSKP